MSHQKKQGTSSFIYYIDRTVLELKPITIEAVEELKRFSSSIPARSCDYTPGNLIMWARFMNYQYAIERDTLFISAKSQADINTPAYLMPIGSMPLEESIALLRSHCQEKGEPLQLTAVPAPYKESIEALLPNHIVTELENWSDYIYSAQSLATLQGKALNKKRNRYNKFLIENPNHEYHRFTTDNTAEVLKFLIADRDCQHNREQTMRCYEQWQCMATVRNLKQFPQPAGVLLVNGELAAFTLGEIFDNTLYVHIEKASRSVVGAGEAINRMFINDILQQHPEITHVNREEDLGDPGLRQVKRAYNPIEMLHRYEFTSSKDE